VFLHHYGAGRRASRRRRVAGNLTAAAEEELSVSGSFSLIVNPAAGAGRSLRILPEITAELDARGLRYQVTRSGSREHARELATAAAVSGSVVIAVGGDGMAAALAGATVGAPTATPAIFGIIPAGRGNDLARVLGIPVAPQAAVRVLAEGRTRRVDLIAVGTPGQPECIVAGSVYAGVPSVAGEIANATRWLTGPAVYPVAALRALAAWRSVRFRLEPADPGPPGPAPPGPALPGPALPGQESRNVAPQSRDFPGCAVVIANSAYFGAGMMVAPPAEIDDGILDIVAMEDGPRLAFLRVLLRIRSGTHVSLPRVALDRAGAVTLTMDRAMPVAADGETLPWACPLPACAPLTVRVLPAAPTVLVPPSA
jgi:diacylglycerol kinase (ATP)